MVFDNIVCRHLVVCSGITPKSLCSSGSICKFGPDFSESLTPGMMMTMMEAAGQPVVHYPACLAFLVTVEMWCVRDCMCVCVTSPSAVKRSSACGRARACVSHLVPPSPSTLTSLWPASLRPSFLPFSLFIAQSSSSSPSSFIVTCVRILCRTRMRTRMRTRCARAPMMSFRRRFTRSVRWNSFHGIPQRTSNLVEIIHREWRARPNRKEERWAHFLFSS